MNGFVSRYGSLAWQGKFSDGLKVLGNLLALDGVCHFVASLSDLIGIIYVALIGATLLVIGTVVASAAPDMNVFIVFSILSLTNGNPRFNSW